MIEERIEGRRGCGFRKPGGLYLVSDGLTEPCPLLPVEMTVCATCGQGIRPARGYTWVDGGKVVPPQIHGGTQHTAVCPFGPGGTKEQIIDGDYQSRLGRCGLIWIGEAFYPTADSFMDEANRMGVSRRITAVPRDFVVGETWVLLGHRKAIERVCPECGDDARDEECPVCSDTRKVHRPGIVTAFRPSAIEYVVKGDETDEEIETMERRGLTCVRVTNDEAQGVLEV